MLTGPVPQQLDGPAGAGELTVDAQLPPATRPNWWTGRDSQAADRYTSPSCVRRRWCRARSSAPATGSWIAGVSRRPPKMASVSRAVHPGQPEAGRHQARQPVDVHRSLGRGRRLRVLWQRVELPSAQGVGRALRVPRSAPGHGRSRSSPGSAHTAAGLRRAATDVAAETEVGLSPVLAAQGSAAERGTAHRGSAGGAGGTATASCAARTSLATSPSRSASQAGNHTRSTAGQRMSELNTNVGRPSRSPAVQRPTHRVRSHKTAVTERCGAASHGQKVPCGLCAH